MKKVFIGVLAALMLVAFTACDNTTPTYKVPISMTAQASKADYLVGETLAAEDITATVYYSDGSSQAFTGVELGVADKTIVAGVNNASVEFGLGNAAVTAPSGSSKSNNVTAVVSVMGYSVDSAVLADLPTTAVWDSEENKATADLSSVSVTVSYNNGTTRVMTEDEFSLSFDMTSIGAGDKGVPAVELKLFGTSDISGKVKLPADYEITVSEGADGNFDDTRTPITYEIVLTDEAGNPVEAGKTYYFGQKISYAINKVDADGDDEPAAKDTDYVFVGTAPVTEGSVTLGADNLKAPVTYTVAFLGSANTMSFTIPQAEDYIASIDRIVPKTSGGPSPNTTASAAQYDFYAKMASDPDAAEAVIVTTGFSAQIIDSKVPAQPATGEQPIEYTPKFEVKFGMLIDGVYSSNGNSNNGQPITTQAYTIQPVSSN